MSAPPRKFDVVGYDEQDQPVVLVEVKRAGSIVSHERLVADLADYLSRARPRIRFFLVADPDQVELYTRAEQGNWRIFHTFQADELFRPYDEAYGRDPVYEHYLATLVENWLRDIAYNWHSSNPAGQDVFQRAGLLESIRNGTTSVDTTL